MISSDGLMVNGKLKVNGQTNIISCKVNSKTVEALATNSTIADNTSSTQLVSASQVVAYITALRS